MKKKYEFVKDDAQSRNGRIIRRIVAIRDFDDVKEGDLGGYIESESNLSQEDTCWVYDNAGAYGGAEVCGRAKVYDNAEVCGNAVIRGGI